MHKNTLRNLLLAPVAFPSLYLAEEDGVADVLGDLGVDVLEGSDALGVLGTLLRTEEDGGEGVGAGLVGPREAAAFPPGGEASAAAVHHGSRRGGGGARPPAVVLPVAVVVVAAVVMVALSLLAGQLLCLLPDLVLPQERHEHGRGRGGGAAAVVVAVGAQD